VEINPTEVNASDQITIRTQFSAYSFRITDPLKARGLLSGGLLGDEQHDAFFAGAISPASEELHESELEAGYRAVFIIAGGDDPKRLTTAIVTEINLSETEPEVC
jgi:hypothetical protein